MFVLSEILGARTESRPFIDICKSVTSKPDVILVMKAGADALRGRTKYLKNVCRMSVGDSPPMVGHSFREMFACHPAVSYHTQRQLFVRLRGHAAAAPGCALPCAGRQLEATPTPSLSAVLYYLLCIQFIGSRALQARMMPVKMDLLLKLYQLIEDVTIYPHGISQDSAE
eukprot:6189285-Pleurochrysis_carterae.AAC.1